LLISGVLNRRFDKGGGLALKENHSSGCGRRGWVGIENLETRDAPYLGLEIHLGIGEGGIIELTSHNSNKGMGRSGLAGGIGRDDLLIILYAPLNI